VRTVWTLRATARDGLGELSVRRKACFCAFRGKMGQREAKTRGLPLKRWAVGGWGSNLCASCAP